MGAMRTDEDDLFMTQLGFRNLILILSSRVFSGRSTQCLNNMQNIFNIFLLAFISSFHSFFFVICFHVVHRHTQDEE